jgi:hypothetical protein
LFARLAALDRLLCTALTSAKIYIRKKPNGHQKWHPIGEKEEKIKPNEHPRGHSNGRERREERTERTPKGAFERQRERKRRETAQENAVILNT